MDEYKKLLKSRIKGDANGDPILAKYYYVARDVIEYERVRFARRLASQLRSG